MVFISDCEIKYNVVITNVEFPTIMSIPLGNDPEEICVEGFGESTSFDGHLKDVKDLNSKSREPYICKENASSSASINKSSISRKPHHDTRDHKFKRVKYGNIVSDLRADKNMKKIERIEMTNMPRKSQSTEQIRIKPDKN